MSDKQFQGFMGLSKARGILMGHGLESTVAEDVIAAFRDSGLILSEAGPPQDSDRPATLEEVVFTALGQASMCWSPGTGDAEFDSVQASNIGNELIRSLRARGAT